MPRGLGPDSWAITCTFRKHQRLSRRGTVWRSTPQGWQILFNQGTLVTPEAQEDDEMPSPHAHVQPRA